MLKIEKFVTMSPEQWEIVIEGMRNPKNSWDRSDSWTTDVVDCETNRVVPAEFFVGPNDEKLMMELKTGGPVHAKYLRMMPVWVTLTAPLYWWKEADTYQVGVTKNSCSTMHKIHAKEFTMDDFSMEHCENHVFELYEATIDTLNILRDIYLQSGMKDKDIWYQMIQLLPSSYNQKRTVFLNYEVLSNIYKWRRNHKLDEWHIFCDWIESLPYSELITGEVKQ